jgi:hypothetical protein
LRMIQAIMMLDLLTESVYFQLDFFRNCHRG